MKTTQLLPVSCIVILLRLLSDRSRSITISESGYNGDIADVALFMALVNNALDFTTLSVDRETNSYTLSIIEPRIFDTARDEVKSYCKHLANDSLSSDLYLNKSWKAQLSEFLRLISDDINFKDFHVQGGKYAPVILYGLINNLIQVKSVDIAYYDKEDTGNRLYDSIIYPRLVSTLDDDSICLNPDCLKVSYTLDITKFASKYKLGKQTSANVSYSSNQKELLRLIQRRQKAPLESERVIYAYEIEDIYSLQGDKRQKQKNRTANVRRLNDKYCKEHGCKILGACIDEKYPIIH